MKTLTILNDPVADFLSLGRQFEEVQVHDSPHGGHCSQVYYVLVL